MLTETAQALYGQCVPVTVRLSVEIQVDVTPGTSAVGDTRYGQQMLERNTKAQALAEATRKLDAAGFTVAGVGFVHDHSPRFTYYDSGDRLERLERYSVNDEVAVLLLDDSFGIAGHVVEVNNDDPLPYLVQCPCVVYDANGQKANKHRQVRSSAKDLALLPRIA